MAKLHKFIFLITEIYAINKIYTNLNYNKISKCKMAAKKRFLRRLAKTTSFGVQKGK